MNDQNAWVYVVIVSSMIHAEYFAIDVEPLMIHIKPSMVDYEPSSLRLQII